MAEEGCRCTIVAWQRADFAAYSHLRAFFQNPNGASVPGEVVLTQWKQMKKLIVSDASLSSMKFNELWPMMLDVAQQFNFILIALTFSVDTSGCERLISLMNNLKTKFQEKMVHETLSDLVWWYKCQHLLKPHESTGSNAETDACSLERVGSATSE